MKSLTFLMALFTTFAVNASTVTGKVTEYGCMEMDPFVVGDICLLNIVQENRKRLAIVLDFDEANEVFFEGEMLGRQVSMPAVSLNTIEDREQLNVLLDYDSSFFYMVGDVSSITVSDPELNSNIEMKKLIKAVGNRYWRSNLPEGYSSKEVSLPGMRAPIKKYLSDMTKNRVEAWGKYVYSDEFYTESNLPLAQIAKNPWKELQVQYVLEVSTVYAIYKSGFLIGYFLNVDDHIEATIIQDGAWIEIFIDLDHKIIQAVEETA